MVNRTYLTNGEETAGFQLAFRDALGIRRLYEMAYLKERDRLSDGALRAVEKLFEERDERDTKRVRTKYSFGGYAEDGRGKYQANFPKGTPKSAKAAVILDYIQNVWSKKPIKLKIKENGVEREIEARFDPTYSDDTRIRTDATKLMGGNRHGSASEQRVTLDLADDYYQIASEATYNYSKDETGKETSTHQGVKRWHYFINDIYFAEYGSEEYAPYRVTINIKEKDDGNFVYSFSAEEQDDKKRKPDAQQTLHAAVSGAKDTANIELSNSSIPQPTPKVNSKKSLSLDADYMAADKYESAYSIVPVNQVTDPEKLAYLVKEFEENDWQGRPILVVDLGNEYQALTGSHRLAAAMKVRMDVPIHILESSSDTVIQEILDARDDDERLRILRENSEQVDAESIRLLEAEEASNQEQREDPQAYQKSRYSLSLDSDIPPLSAAEVEENVNRVSFGFEWTEEKLFENLKRVKRYLQQSYAEYKVDFSIDNEAKRIVIEGITPWGDPITNGFAAPLAEEDAYNDELAALFRSIGVSSDRIREHLSVYTTAEEKAETIERAKEEHFCYGSCWFYQVKCPLPLDLSCRSSRQRVIAKKLHKSSFHLAVHIQRTECHNGKPL